MKKVKLNLGSGPVGIPGWINFDSGILPWLSKKPKLRKFICDIGLLPKNYDVRWPEIQLVDIRKRFPLDDNSVDYIYCSQVLEHFERYEAVNVLREAYRVLKSNGVIRISIPSIEKMIKVYQKNLIKSPGTAARDMNITWWGYEKDIAPSNTFLKLSRLFIRDHQWQYDKNSMKQLLLEAGFKGIKFYSFRKGTIPDLNKLEIELHSPHSMYVEARK